MARRDGSQCALRLLRCGRRCWLPRAWCDVPRRPGAAAGSVAWRTDRHHGERRDRMAAGAAAGDRARQCQGGAAERDGEADRLIAFYRPKSGARGRSRRRPASPTRTDTGGNEIYRVQAEGHVRIFTADRSGAGRPRGVRHRPGGAGDDRAGLKLTTPNDVLTARDSLEYWSQKHMAVARGNAVVVTNDGRRLAADTLVAYTSDAPAPPARRRRQRSRTPTIRWPRRASCRRSRRSATSRSAPRPTPRSAIAPSMCRTPASRGWPGMCASRAGRTSSMGRRRK